MRKAILALALFPLLVFAQPSLTDEQIKDRIIQESIAQYPGNCPCPYNLARNGSQCGKRSAYSKPGGFNPVCYPQDVSPQMVQQYRKQHRLQ